MKTKGYIPFALIFALVLSSPLTARTAEIEGVRFSEVYQSDGMRLPLQGTGLFRYMGLFKVYVGAIYYEAGLAPADLLADKAKRLEVSYFHALKGDDFGPVTNKMITKNIDRHTFEKIRHKVDYHNSLYEDVVPGDRYALTYIPGRGTELSLNGETLGVIRGADFAAALFAMWLGDNPMNRAFKNQLLGVE